MDDEQIEDARPSERITNAVDTKTGEFLDCGDRPGSIRVELPRNPDPLREKYSGDPANPFVPKAPEDIVTALEQKQRETIPAPFKALVLYALETSLGKVPTEAEIAVALDRYAVLLKGLV